MTKFLNSDGELVDIPTVFLRTPYNYDTDAASLQTGLKCEDESRAQQQFKEESDINTIVERFGLTGELPSEIRMPVSGDFTEHANDFHSAMNLIRQAEEQFMLLPAEIRAEFENNPQNLLDFLENPANIDKARELGIVNKPPEVPKPMQVEVVNVSSSEPEGAS